MRNLLAAAVMLMPLVGVAAAGDNEHSSPMHELGQSITCQAMHISLAHLYAVSAASLANITPQTDEVTKLVKAETDRAARETAKAKDGVRLQAETIIPELQDRKPDELKEQARKLFAQALAEIDAVTDDLTADTETMTEVIGLLSRQSAACDKFATDLENEHTE